MTAATKQTPNNGTVHNTKGDLFASFNVEDFAVPTFKDEEWRFISLRRIRGLHDGTFAPAVEQDIAVSIPEGAEANVTAETVAPDDARLGRAGAPIDRVAAQAWTSMPNAQYLGFKADTVTKEPVVVTITGRGEGVTSFGATSIELGAHAEATVVIEYRGSGTHADNIEFIIGDGARLDVIVDANWENDAVHLSGQLASLGRDSVLRHNVATFGGDTVRIFPRVKYTAEGGDAELHGVYFADAGQYFENRMLVDHSFPNCRSNVLYKGALQGKRERGFEARTCWVGDVLIRAAAKGTDTYETNRNLILTDGARADAIPNLEIETGEIAGAGHAATVGRFDDEQLFYLQARGIPEDEAMRLIVQGFFLEVINLVPVESVRERLEQRIVEELSDVNVRSL